MMAEKLEIVEHETLAEALLFAQSEYPPLEKGKDVKVSMKSGQSYGYSYADLASTKRLTDPHLWKHGLVVRDKTETRDGKEYLVSTLTHVASKEFETSELDVTEVGGDMKNLGGNITYARRYNYWNLTGRIGEDDNEERPNQRRQNQPESDAGTPNKATNADDWGKDKGKGGGKSQGASKQGGGSAEEGTGKPTPGPKERALALQNERMDAYDMKSAEVRQEALGTTRLPVNDNEWRDYELKLLKLKNEGKSDDGKALEEMEGEREKGE